MNIRQVLTALSIVCFTSLVTAQLPYTEQGLVERLENFPTDYISPRHVDIWTPEGYDPTKKYPVIYMHDGQMLFDSTNTWNHQEWKVDEVLSQLISEKMIKPCIVVGIHSSKTRYADYFPQKAFEILPLDIKNGYMPMDSTKRTSSTFPNGPQADNYLKFIVKELKPFIDSKFATISDSTGTYVAGSSMGGLISMYAMFEYPSVFGAAGCISTHWIGGFNDNDNPIPAAFLHYMNKNMPDSKSHKSYFDHGTVGLDSMYTVHQLKVNYAMRDAGYLDNRNLKTDVYQGHNHNERYWAERLDEVFLFLFVQ